ncbi:alpha-amylase C-terminal beta-sheet domain-containing protein [Vitiosangium sp. GDMCC 1.1324]|uniref:alpha-amylase C-terminal beta-sheet domain-containing protein n=1 Tax=Vitiosangium sp. (strain GDMCC 1.1324) TaxID=2138576 RepID=UPI000D375242|nr:alpha-amylase C-terminal beta-sheet domain-containing protein [Vitiosangium sp. GDMCC 1.1324]PTL81954.1 alpha-amylase [Vitiosangium sp. GDMCC 1.1324]
MFKQRVLGAVVSLSWALGLAVASAAHAGPLDGNSSDVMLQGFHWRSTETSPWWGVIQSKASDIKASGFTMVWLPPSGDSAAKEGYLPRQLYVQSSSYGTDVQLKSAIGALHTYGVKAIGDIVINHRVGTTNWADFTNPTWGASAVVKGDEWTGATGNADTGDGFSAARDLDHTNGTVQSDIKSWLGWMKSSIGYDGWRYDYVKGYAGSYVGSYNSATAPYFSVGELWTDLNLNDVNPHRQKLMDWINATGGNSGAFDFTTKGILQQAAQYGEYGRLKATDGKPQGAIGWWPAKSVTFVDNHDTGPSFPSGGQNHWPFPNGNQEVMQGYAYILTHPGIPCVYWVHYYDWDRATYGDKIKTLIAARKEKGVTSTSAVTIVAAQTNLYAATIAGNSGSLAMKLGSTSWSPGTGWTLVTSGNNWAVWKK